MQAERTQVFRVERRNPLTNRYEGFAALDSFDAAVRWIAGYCELDVSGGADAGDRGRMRTPGEVWRFLHDGIHWRVINATEQDRGSVR